jgi:murein DD-endopeptidase MepM/ murein hydrolase activator NlpD
MIIAAAIVAAALTVTPSARAMQPGELVVLSVSSEVPLTSVHARAFNTDIIGFEMSANDPTHWRVLVGIDLDATLGRHPVTITATSAAGSLTATYPLVVVAKKFPTRRLTVVPAFVNPPASAMARIAEDTKEQQVVWASSASSRLWATPFIRPVPQAANSAFGTRSVFNGEPRGAHSGADFLSPAGTPIKAPNAGRVMLAKDLYYSGNTVIIDHGLGVFSFLCHMSQIDVKVGDTVEPGQVVGLVGATGRVTGAHLHWTLRVAGARVDPLALLALLGK